MAPNSSYASHMARLSRMGRLIFMGCCYQASDFILP